MEEKSFYRPHEVAAMYDVGHRTVYKWIRRGYLPAVKDGQWKIPAGDLAAFTPPKNGRPRIYQAAALDHSAPATIVSNSDTGDAPEFQTNSKK